MVKNIGRRFLSFFMTAVMVLMLLPEMTLPTFAATSGTVTLSDDKIELSYKGTGNDAWNVSNGSIIGSVMSVSTSTGCGSSTTAYESTLTIKNARDTTATLEFDYTLAQNSGTIKVGGNAVTAGGKFSKELESGGSVEVYIKSGSTSNATKITISNVNLIVNTTATTTFVPAGNGNYTVNGIQITEEYTNAQSAETAYTMKATANSGYQFVGWYDVTNAKYISTVASTSLNIGEDCTITAKFVPIGTALFETGGQIFESLNEAGAYASNNKISRITLTSSGTLAGKHTIPVGVTLLIPFDAAGTMYTDNPTMVADVSDGQTIYRKLTLAENAEITVCGAISIGGHYYPAYGGAQCWLFGSYGQIDMDYNSKIEVETGGNLYAWGFITGEGSVVAKSGSTVYEYFQLYFRGGTASSAMNSGVFPISQYYVQNIEVPLILNSGANEITYAGVTAKASLFSSDYIAHKTSINFIGDSGMFNIVGGSLTKDYDEETDRLIMTISDGTVEVNSISLSLAGTEFDSSSYDLPITHNITVNIEDGSTLKINKDVALLPGVEMNVAQGGEIIISSGANAYIYDADDWGNFGIANGQYTQVTYISPGTAKHSRTKDETIKDVKIDVNGTLTVNGYLYTTAGGANITSSKGTGKYVQSGTIGTQEETYQYTQADSTSKADIPITPAKLRNEDGSYTTTSGASAGDVYYYCLTKCGGVWHKLAEYPVAQSTSTTLYDGSGTAALADETAKTFETLTEAINSTTDGTFIRLLHDVPPEKVQMSDDVHLDLNGCNAHVDFTGSGTVYAIDSATDYELDDETHKVTYSASEGKITGTTLPDKFAKTVTVTGDGVTTSFKRYVMVQDGAAYSFHRFNISTTGFRVLFDPMDMTAVIYYSGIARGDAKAAGEIKEYGFIFDDDKKSYKASNATIDAEFESALAWGGILDSGNVNTKYSAQAYVTIGGNKLCSTEREISLLDGLAYAYNRGVLSMPNAVGEPKPTEEEIRKKLDTVMNEMGLADAWNDAKTKENWKSAKTA